MWPKPLPTRPVVPLGGWTGSGDPVVPAGPVDPVGPVAPVAPVAPVGPVPVAARFFPFAFVWVPRARAGWQGFGWVDPPGPTGGSKGAEPMFWLIPGWLFPSH